MRRPVWLCLLLLSSAVCTERLLAGCGISGHGQCLEDLQDCDGLGCCNGETENSCEACTTTADCPSNETCHFPDLNALRFSDLKLWTPSADKIALTFGWTVTNVAQYASLNHCPACTTGAAQNLYRYTPPDPKGHGGRFEQVGQSWLKHAYGGTTSFCIDGSTEECQSSSIGPNCSDSYGAVTNQYNLGPKLDRNPHTGVSYAGFTLGTYAGGLLRTFRSDVTHPGTTGWKLFMEHHEVSPDDATAHGNDPTNNNMYWQLPGVCSATNVWCNQDHACPGSETCQSFFDTCHGAPNCQVTNFNGLAESDFNAGYAIQAWGAADSAVEYDTVSVPGDGSFIVASKVVQLTGGKYSYEYAIFNRDSDRGARRFTVPAQSVVLASIGFHDADYWDRDGVKCTESPDTPAECPYDTDWTGTYESFGGGAVSWKTVSYAGNPKSNALRWSTLYNYRFTSGLPPQPVSATIELFKPGSPSTVTVTVPGPQ